MTQDSGLRTQDSLSDRVMACAWCNQTMAVGDGDELPLHSHRLPFSNYATSTCPGSYTRAHPHRFVPEIKPLRIEMLPDEMDEEVRAPSRNLLAITECAKFLCDWVNSGLRVDNVQMSKVIAHTTNARQGATRLLRT